MNRDSYDRIAGPWAASRSEFVLREREYLDAVLADVHSGLVLDLGCGTGRPMAEYVLARGHRVVGIDQSRGMLEVAAQRLPQGRWVQGRIEDGGWRGRFDAVICWDAIFHIERRHHPRILARISDSLAPGARAMLTLGGSANPPFTDTMFGVPFFYDSLPPTEFLALLPAVQLSPVIAEFMEVPTGGRDRGRYAVVVTRI